jgi:hypothetical protein
LGLIAWNTKITQRKIASDNKRLFLRELSSQRHFFLLNTNGHFALKQNNIIAYPGKYLPPGFVENRKSHSRSSI